MDYKKYGQRPYILAAPIAFAVAFIGLMVAAAVEPSWNYYGSYDLSDLGTENRRFITNLLFNGACCIAGILISVFGFGKYHFEKDWNEKAGVFFFISGVGLFFVGIFSADYDYQHNFSAGVFATGLASGVVLSTLQDIKDGNRFILYSGIVILAFLIIEWPFFNNALSETMGLVSATAWFIIQMHKYWKQGKLRPVIAQKEETVPENV